MSPPATTGHPRSATAARGLAVSAAATLLLLASCATPRHAPGPDLFLGLPDPLSGPGAPVLSEDLRSAVEIGWSELAAGDPTAARQRAARAVATAPGRLLDLQITLAGGDPPPVEALAALVAEHPGYGAARATLSIAAERAGSEPVALSEARRTAALWPTSPWTRRTAELEGRWIHGRLETATRDLAEGRAQPALDLAEAVLELEEDNLEARLLQGRSLLALDRVPEAKEVLSRLAPEPSAVELLGSLAELDGDWLKAMETYQSLPDGWPGRGAALERVQLRWRLSVLPPYVQEGLAAAQLTRAQFAALMVAMAPQLEAVEGGAIPLITDVVGLPMQREILTLVRLELLESDPLEKRFDPGRPISARNARSAVEGLAHLLGLKEPVWCDDSGVISSHCIHLEAPVSGEALATTVLQLVQESHP